MYSPEGVPFVLKISRGAGQGEEFSFEQAEARLGRTADNDIVVKDGGASRSHARVFEKNERYWVEDLGSANGTRVNNAPLKAARELKNGDTITIGDVSFEFAAQESTMLQQPSSTMDDGGGEDELENEDPNSTVLKPPRSGPAKALVRKPTGAQRRAPDPEPEPEPPAEEPADEPDEDPNATMHRSVPPPRALSRAAAGPVARARPGREPADDAPAPLSAAERARQRRELSKSASGKAQLFWQDASKPVRIVVGLLLGVLGLGTLGAVGYVVIPRSAGPARVEPKELVVNGAPIAESFGEGEGVTFRQIDQKAFEFSTASPTRVVGVLHYAAHDCSKEEVSISLNGSDLGFVPPDSLDADREIDLILPATVLKAREANTLVFDNVNNPPNKETWRIAKIWVEIIPVPDMSAEQAGRSAKEQIEKANAFYRDRDLGADNLFRAWKTFREAWLLLEATPDSPKELQQMARTRMREIRPELDHKCATILVDYKKAMNARPQNLDRARQVLESIPMSFPTREHPCFSLSKELIRDLADISEMENK